MIRRKYDVEPGNDVDVFRATVPGCYSDSDSRVSDGSYDSDDGSYDEDDSADEESAYKMKKVSIFIRM